MGYITLEKSFHADNTPDRYVNHDELYLTRFENESTFRTGIELQTGEMFLAVPRELSRATEQVLRRERRVSALWRALPPVALGAYIRSLIMDEVVYSNEIEGVFSTRRQIEVALSAGKGDAHTPFEEFARLYLNLIDRPAIPGSLEEIREIYDSVVADTIDPNDVPKKQLFRSGPVEIVDQTGTTVHKGVAPNDIERLMGQWIDLSKNDAIPELYSAALCHFLFGYIHPFYDGNGRTGRFLLALHLSKPLSQPTVLSLSRTIAEHRAMYYRAFNTVERPLNRGEATHFVLTLLDLVAEAQEGLIANLEEKRAVLERLDERVEGLTKAHGQRQCGVLYYAAQMQLYSVFGETRLTDLAKYLRVSLPTARKTMNSLVEDRLFKKVSSRPAVYRLSEQGIALLELE